MQKNGSVRLLNSGFGEIHDQYNPQIGHAAEIPDPAMSTVRSVRPWWACGRRRHLRRCRGPRVGTAIRPQFERVSKGA
jgi:hypothetical protein